jgi:hypothetical protein
LKKTISQVATEPRIWEGSQYGPLAFVKVTFTDSSQGDVACKPENAEKVIGILEGLKGQEHEFGLEAKDDYEGIAQFKIKDYPGKPGQQQGGGGGGGGFRSKSPEEQSSIRRQTALKSAAWVAAAAGVTSPEATIAVAESFYAWLSEGPQQPSADNSATPDEAGAETSGGETTSETAFESSSAPASPPVEDMFRGTLDELIGEVWPNKPKISNAWIAAWLKKHDRNLGNLSPDEQNSLLADVSEVGSK